MNDYFHQIFKLNCDNKHVQSIVDGTSIDFKKGWIERKSPKNDDETEPYFPGEYASKPQSSFCMKVPNGNYLVTMTLSSDSCDSMTTVKANNGHIVLKDVHVKKRGTRKLSFTSRVDDYLLKLALLPEIKGDLSVEVELVSSMPTIFLAGDSTMTDNSSSMYPFTGWGQMFSLFLSNQIAVANHAKSGRSSRSFIEEGRLDKIWKDTKRGDILMIQFSHNDEKPDERGTDPKTTFPAYLMEYIVGARERGVTPVLITPMHRRFFDEGGIVKDTHGPYIKAIEKLSIEESVPLIPLDRKSKELYGKLGVGGSKKLFMWLQENEYPNFAEALEDNTHFNVEGAVEIACLVAESIQEENIQSLIKYLKLKEFQTEEPPL
ncbi:SGNH/GDSL hydrolase family protein [Salipaludibacillus sp. CF4.18]|uniref:SGNH/GDSL hydrolase family protein n=1 Tax=Salipaludibacillus sp. CF4.18 TaxID=3373081 RepID=UPI003EE6D50D